MIQIQREKADNAFIIAICIIILCTILSCISAIRETKPDYSDTAEIIDSADLTLEELENRNGKLIIERVVGVVDDAETGAGHQLDNANYYISYKYVDGISNGDIMCTYFIYNPDTNYCDDIIMRFDYVIDG